MANFWDRQFQQVKAGDKAALTIDEMQERGKAELELQDAEVQQQEVGVSDVGKAAASGVLGWAESISEAAAKPEFTAEQQQQVVEEGYDPEVVTALQANKNILELVAEKGRDWFGANKENVRNSMSVNAKKALEAEIIDENLSFTDDATKLTTWIMKGTETLSRMVPDLVIGGMGSKQIYNQTFDMMYKKGIEKGLTEAGARIAADKVAKGAMSSSTAQLATISATGGSGVQIRETVENTPWNELVKSDTFQANFKAIDADPQYAEVSDKEKLNLARTMTADQASQKVQQDPALLTANVAASFLGDVTLGRIIQGRIGGGIAEKAIKGVAAEAPTEAGQGAMEQYAQNLALIEVAGADIDPTKGVARSALEGAILGGAIGGGVGATTGAVEKVTGREQVVDMPEEQAEAEAVVEQAAEVEPTPTVSERREALDERLRTQRVTEGIGEVQEALSREGAKTPEQLIAEARQQPQQQAEEVAEVVAEEKPATVAERREALNRKIEQQRAAYEQQRIEAGEGEVQQRLSRPSRPSAEELIRRAPEETGPTPGELEFRRQQNVEYPQEVKDKKIPQGLRGKPGASRIMNKGYRKAMEDLGSLAGKISGKKELAPEVDTMSKTLEKLGGLNRQQAEAEGIDPASFKRSRVFPATGGLTFDHAAELLNEQGYRNREGGQLSANDVVDMVYGEVNNSERHLSANADADMLTADADMVRDWAEQIGGADKLNTAIQKALKGEKLGKRQAEIVEDVLETVNSIRSGQVEDARATLNEKRAEREQQRINEFNQAYSDITEVDDSYLSNYQRYEEMWGEMPDHFTEQQAILSELVANAGDRDYEATEQLITDYDNGNISLPNLLDQLSEIASREQTYEEAKPRIQTTSEPAPQRTEGSDVERTREIEEPQAAEPEPTAETEQRIEPEPTAQDVEQDPDSFTNWNAVDSEGQPAEQTFRKGDYAKAVRSDKDKTFFKTAEIAGISHKRKEAKIAGIWHDFGSIVKAEKPEEIKKPTKKLSKVIESVNKKQGAEITEADRIQTEKPESQFTQRNVEDFQLSAFGQRGLAAGQIRDAAQRIRIGMIEGKTFDEAVESSRKSDSFGTEEFLESFYEFMSEGEKPTQKADAKADEDKKMFMDSIELEIADLEFMSGDAFKKETNRIKKKIYDEYRSERKLLTRREYQTLNIKLDRAIFEKGKAEEAVSTDYANKNREEWEDISKQALEGDLTPDQYNAAAKQMLADKERIQAEINKAYTKPQLIKKLGPMAAYRAKSDKKPYAVNAYFNQLMMRLHIVDDALSYGMGKDAFENAIIKSTEGLTQEQIDSYKEKLAAKREEYSQRFKKTAKAVKDPETLEEFKEFISIRGEGAMTPEQRSRYDQLITAERMEKEQEQKKAKGVKEGLKAEGEVDVVSMEPGTHGKTGEPIINVKLSQLGKDQFKQAAAQARAMKGGYWRGNFYLPDQQAADQFVAWAKGETIDRSEQVTKGEEIKQKAVTQKLTTMSKKIRETAEGELNADRRENTVRQMRQADSSRAKAEKQIELADMMDLIAEGFEDGSIKFLSGITSKAQLEEVIRSYDALKYNVPNPSTNDLVQMDNMSRPYWKDSTTIDQKVQFARLPFLDFNGHMIGELARRMSDVTGYKQASNALAKLAKQTGERNYTTLDTNAAYFDKALKFAKEMDRYTTFADQAARYSRLAKMGIDNGSALRAALIELDGIKAKLKQPKQKTTIETMERDLKRKIRLNRNAFNDFFPTPQTISQDIVELADIKPGMKVLEPSAGNGELAQAAANAGGDVDVVELAGDLRAILSEKGFNLIGDDFTKHQSGPDYDRIVMNPPFSNDQDIDHIYHAFNMLKPGGRIVAITSSMAGNRSNNKNKQFREWLDNLNAEERDLPSDAFMDSLNPTGVNTKVITIDKPEGDAGNERTQFSQDSRTTGSPKGVAIKEAEMLAAQFLKKYKGAAGATVKVFATQKEALDYNGITLPDDVRVNAYRIPQTGEIVLVAENLDGPRDVWRKLRHEILAHHGLYNVVGEQEWLKIMDLVSQSRTSSELKETWALIDKHYPELNENLKAEEVIAHIAEHEPGKFGEWSDRIISAVIRALRNVGLISQGMKDVEVRDLIRVVGERIKSLDSANASIRNDVMFSKEVAEESGFSIPDETKKDAFVRSIADKYQRLKVIQQAVKEQGGRITEAEDVYRAEELFHGKTGEDMRVMEEDYIKPLQDVMSKRNIEAGELDLYLVAKHAPERNAYIAKINPKMQDGGSGMTNAEAVAILDKFEQEGRTDDMKAAAKYVYDMLANTRNTLVESGLETSDAVNSWSETYKNYVPLKGFANNEIDDKGDVIKPTGKGFNIRGKETMRAMGRRTMADSPLAYAISDATASIIRARKNEVAQTMLRMVDANPDPDLWQVFSDENPDISRKIVRKRNPVTGKIEDQVIDTPAPMFMMKDKYLGVKMNGEQYYIKLNDPRLMSAMANMGVEQSNLLTRTVGRFTRLLSALITSYNPEFALSNFARDVQTAVYNVMAETEIKGGKAEGKKGLAAQMTKDIMNGNSIKALRKGFRDNDFSGEWGGYLKEFLESGAKTGWFVQKDIDEIKNDIQKAMTRTGPGAKNALMRSKDKMIKFIDDYNDIIENASRLSVYANGRKAGLSQSDAASLAKNLTVNFNRRGEMTNNINALYMFFNASVQGTVNMLRAIATPKDKAKSMFNPSFYNTTQKIAMMLPIATMGFAALNRSVGGEDDDGKAYYDKIPDFVKETNFVMVIPGSDGDYIKIPMPYGYNFFAGVGHALDRSINGEQTIVEGAFDLASVFAGAFSPLGSVDSEESAVQVVKTASPTMLRPFIEMAVNENFSGSPIYKQQNPYGLKTPDSYNAQRRTWEWAKGVSEWLNDATGGNQFKSGYVDIAPESWQHMIQFIGGGALTTAMRTQDYAAKKLTGEEVEDRDVPFWRKYFGNISQSVDIAEMYKRFDDVKEAERQLEGLPRQEALKYRANNMALVRLIPMQKEINKRLTKLNKRKREIEASEKLSDERKKEIVDRIEEQKKLLATKFNKRYNDTVGN